MITASELGGAGIPLDRVLVVWGDVHVNLPEVCCLLIHIPSDKASSLYYLYIPL